MDLETQLSFSMFATATKAGDLTSTVPNSVIRAQYVQKLLTGVGADQADTVYADEATMIADAFAPYALDATVKDVFGDNVVLARVKGVYFKNTSTLASTLKFGGGTGGIGTNAWATWVTSTAPGNAGSEGVLIPQGGFVFLWAPDATAWAVAGGDLIIIEEMSTLAASFDLVIIGSTT